MITPDFEAAIREMTGESSHEALNGRPKCADSGVYADLAVADRILAHYRDDIRYCSATGYYLWDGARWALDETEQVFARGEQVVRNLYKEASKEADPELAKALAKLAISHPKAERVNGALRFARTHVAVTVAELDRDPFLLNVKNGTIDLRTGELRLHKRDDLITRLIPLAYSADAKAPRWYQFLGEIFGGDLELCEYVKRAVGYSLTGSQREKCFWFLHGPTNTGKSTFAEIALSVAGDYGQAAPPSIFLRDRQSIPTDQARLMGVRVAIASETGEGRHFDAEKIKKLTGDDRIVARFMRRDFFEFKASHHLWLLSNYKPHAKSDDDAMWSRVKLIPFVVQFVDADDAANRMDKSLRDALTAELPGILAWAVEGAREWYATGLREPARVKVATAEYRDREDVLAQFIRECVEREPGTSVKRSEMYAAYKEWSAGERQMGKQAFNTALRDQYGFGEKDIGAGGIVWLDARRREP